MRNKLQYVYSITVFIGVLMCSYMMMNTEDSSRLPLHFMQGAGPTGIREATVVDPVVNQLFEFEEALSNQYKDEKVPSPPKRKPTDSQSPDL